MTRSRRLVERDAQLHALDEVVAESAHQGGVVLLSGEAGFGKTVLLKLFVDGLDHRYRVLTAACEPVGVPAPFAPLFDVLDDLPDELRNDIRTGSGRQAVLAGMLDLLKNDRIILIIEDLHWSDESTLGLVRYLGRRIESTSSCLIVTFRLEEIDLTHPLRLVIADLGGEATRIDLPPLTMWGVEQLTQGLDLDPVQVHAATLGNPFFVEAVLRHPEKKLPPTIENAIVANVGQLPKAALELLYLVALSPEGVELELLKGLDSEAGTHVDLAIQRRMLVSERGQVTCRHDLIRECLVQSVPPVLKTSLHYFLLTFLESRADNTQNTARLAYHSIGAGHADKALKYSLQAARDAVKASAHRHAAFHYSNALEFRAGMDLDLLQRCLLDAAIEHYLINSFQLSIDLSRQRIDLTETLHDQARARAWVSFFESRQNNIAVARREAMTALEVLRLEPASEELALALCVLGMVDRMMGAERDCIANSDEAVEVARVTGSPWIEVQAATSAGGSRLQLSDRSGREQIEEAIRLGIEVRAVDAVARAMYSLAISYYFSFDVDEARRWFGRGIEYTSAGELDAWYIALLTTVAAIDVATGHWADADQNLERVLGQRTCISTEVEALATVATLRARRGDPRSTEMIEEVLARIDEDSGLSERLMVSRLAMEGAWLGLLPRTTASDRYRAVLASGYLADDKRERGIFAFWARRLDFDPPEGDIPGPAGLEWGGQPEKAAEKFEDKGFPLEAAICRALSPDADLDAVFSSMARLGAEGAARGLRLELTRRGVKRIPRGGRATTRRHPAGLTSRQAEVLKLMTAGLSNAGIAGKLYISEKTAGHHVSAILSKLNASSRSQAVAVAAAKGWADLGG
ncbi:MAG: helix-turn-helix transcriptional regulator [Acidimicrobiia bacterium]